MIIRVDRFRRIGMGSLAAALAVFGAAAGWTGPQSASTVSGTILHQDGRPAPGAIVTVRHPPSGRAFTVYARQGGAFTVAGLPPGTLSLEVRSPRAEAMPRASRSGEASSLGGTVTLAPPTADDEPPASSFLAQLPSGDDKNRFIVDCGGCHTFSSFHARKENRERTRAEWESDIARMLSFAGQASAFPIISNRAHAGRDASWLSQALAGAPWPETQELAPGTLVNTRARLTEYDVPTPGDLPHDLAVDARGRVVVTGMFTHQMYVLDPSDGAFETVAIPIQGANPRALDIDARGRWVVALGGPRAIAIYDPESTDWSTRAVGSYPHSVALDTSGRIWFNGHFSRAPEVVGWYDPAADSTHRYVVPPAGGSADERTIQYGLRSAPDGTIWSTQLSGNHLVRLDPTSEQVDLYEMPTAHSGPRRPDVAPDGTIWIPEFGAGKLARFDPQTETFTEFELPVGDSGPYVVRVDQRRGTVWLGTGHGDLVLSFDPQAEEFTAYPLPTRGALIRHLDIDERTGAVWAAYGASPGIPGKILRIQP